jgi:serine phosphatase RsbU (regulator of sigma subunit)
MLGIALLNQIVAQQHETQASKILEQMRALVKSYLGQTGINEEPKDGMDMSLCVWDVKTNEGNYSGAYNPLWQIRNGELKTFEAVKNPVGIHTREVPFQDSFFQIEKGDKYYMFSDGYCDQFSGTRHEKYKTTRFKKMLLETAGLTMNQQGDMITKNYWDWKGDFVQIDDVCVLGVEI